MPAPALVALASALGPKVLDLVSEVVTDRDRAKELSHQITSAVTDNAHELALEQIKTNRQESQHRTVFVAGWRPAIGWVGATSLAVNFVVIPIANGVLAVTNPGTEIPLMDTGPVLTILGGMLGLGTLRSWEKDKGLTK